MMVGAVNTVKKLELIPLPAMFVTPIAPVDAPMGTTAVMEVSEITPIKLAKMPEKVTEAPVNPVPVRVTVVPGAPEVGENVVIVGRGMTVKLVALVPVPSAFVTVIVPVLAPDGTVAVIEVFETTE